MTSTVTNSHQNRIDVASVLARAESLQPLIREHAARGERERRLPEESLKALIDAGVFRLGQPRRYGGAQADIRSTIEASAIVGEAAKPPGVAKKAQRPLPVSASTACSPPPASAATTSPSRKAGECRKAPQAW